MPPKTANKQPSKTKPSPGQLPSNFPPQLPNFYQKFVTEQVVLSVVIKYSVNGHIMFGEVPAKGPIEEWADGEPTKLIPITQVQRAYDQLIATRELIVRKRLYRDRILSRRIKTGNDELKDLVSRIDKLNTCNEEEQLLSSLAPELKQLIVLNTDDFRRYAGLDFGMPNPDIGIDKYPEEEREKVLARQKSDREIGVPIRKALSNFSSVFTTGGSVDESVYEKSLRPRILEPGFLRRPAPAEAAGEAKDTKETGGSPSVNIVDRSDPKAKTDKKKVDKKQ